MTPILYKRTRTGAIQYWEVTTSTSADGTSSIIKRSGQYGTDSPLEHIKEIKEGKNIGKKSETTPRQQAEAEALSQWKKKQDEGYKTLESLGVGHADNPSGNEFLWQVNNVVYHSFKEVLEAALPKYNSDAQGNVKPMLAQSVNWKKVYYPCIVQPKFDGVRCLILFDGKEAKFLSRTGKEYTTLGHIKAEVETNLKEPIALDGEIYSHELTFQEIVAAVKKQRDDSLKLQFRLYDVVSALGAQERQDKVQEIVCTMSWKHIYSAPSMKCTSQKEVMDLHVHYVSEGYEGVMIRLLENTGYEQGQRSSSLLKVKQYDSNEYLFMHFELGQRGVEDLIAVCSARCTDGVWHETFKAKMQGTVAQKEDIYNNPPPEMTLLTVKHHGYTNDGLPRFPIGVTFRDYE
jgi:DNA ligase-1